MKYCPKRGCEAETRSWPNCGAAMSGTGNVPPAQERAVSPAYSSGAAPRGRMKPL